jgi:hypothetical protein
MSNRIQTLCVLLLGGILLVQVLTLVSLNRVALPQRSSAYVRNPLDSGSGGNGISGGVNPYSSMQYNQGYSNYGGDGYGGGTGYGNWGDVNYGPGVDR